MTTTTAGRGTRRRTTGRVFVLVNTVMLWVTTIIAATALWPIYRSTAIIVLVIVALAVGSIIVIVSAEFRWPSFVVLLVSVAAFLLIGVPLAVPAKTQFGVLPTLDGLVDLVTGVALGWKQLLTISLPVGDYQALLVPALVLVLVTTVVGLTLALRAKYGELAVLAPIALFIVATAFGPRFPDRPLAAPIALLVAVLFWLVWFRWYRRRAAIRSLAAQSDGAAAESGFSGLRTVIAAAVILAVASSAAVAAVGVVPPGADRTVLRTSLEQPFDPRDYVSPLSGFRSYWKAPTTDDVLFQVTGLPDGGRVRIATLDTYDGVVYAVGSSTVSSLSGSFTRVPSTVDQSGVAGDQVTLGVTVQDYSGVWLPTVGKLESVTFAGSDAAALRDSFYYNDVSGTAAVVRGLARGDSYTLDAVVPDQPTDAQLASLEPGTARVPSPQNVPDELTAKLDEYTTGIDTAGKRLVAMLAGLATDGYISHGGEDEPASRSGHAADRIAELLSSPRMIGDAEQYAVAAALMANDLGFPSRVVLGFVPSGESVTGSDVSAWIEVDTAQYGWVAIDPVPQDRPIPEEEPEEESQVARPPSIVPPPPDRPDPQADQTAPDSTQDEPDIVDPVLAALLAVARVVGVGALVVAVVLAPFLLIVAAKVRRRRLRRTAPDVVQRISGGWDEFADAVIDHGYAAPPAATRSELAAVAGGLPSRVLAAVADRAVFAPERADPADADRVWDAVGDLRASLDLGLTRRQRLRALVSLRSLGAYSVRSLFRREGRHR